MKHTVILILAILIGCLSGYSKGNSQPDSYAYIRGVEAYRNGEYQDAIDWFNKEISENPDNGYAYLYVAIVRYGNDDYGMALSAINNALKRIPKKDKEWRALAFASRAEVYVATTDTIKALQDLSEAIKLDASSSEFRSTRAQLYFEQNDYTSSDADYSAMIALDEGDVMGYMGIGRNAKAQGKWEDAITNFNQAIKLSPDYSSGYSFRAEAYIAQEKWNEATDDIIKALDIDGDDKAFLLMKNLTIEASNMLKSKLKIKSATQPINRYWPYCIATVAEANNEYDDAISYYEKANSLDANSIILERISKCYVQKRDYIRALDYAERALAMSPEDYDVIDLKADILSYLGRFDDAVKERDRYVARYPGYTIAYIARAEDLVGAERFEEAIQDYNTAMVLAPFLTENSYLLMKRGDAYRFIGKIEEANKDYELLINIEKDDVLTSDSWTPFAYSGLGNKEKAIKTMKFILAGSTEDVAGDLYNAACVYARLGLKDEAIKYLKEAIEKGYNNYRRIETDYDMDCLRDEPEFQEIVKSLSRDNQMDIANGRDNLPDSRIEIVEVPFTKEGGVTKVKCTINGLPLYFVFDTGAADVTISMVEANFMLKNDYIKPTDIIGSARYMDANGNITEGTVVNLRNVNFGGLELENVRASVVRNQKAPLLLGQSVLGRLGKIEIDNPGMKLVISHKK